MVAALRLKVVDLFELLLTRWASFLVVPHGRPRALLLAALTLMVAVSAAALSHARNAAKASRGNEAAFSSKLDLPPLLLRPLAAEQALLTNAAIPFARAPLISSRPYDFSGDDEARRRALECLASAIYYEAASEPIAGQRAVAQVVLNRVRHPEFPASVCGVVFQGATLQTGCQFSFTCDGSLLRSPGKESWSNAWTIAHHALSGYVFADVGLSTHYHADYVVPYWATSLAKRAKVGRHIFYAWPNGAGRPVAFNQRPSLTEIDPSTLRTAALHAHAQRAPGQKHEEQRILEASADPIIDLAGIIVLLAREPTTDENDYQRSARAYFFGHDQHLAVQLFRSIGSAMEAPAEGAAASRGVGPEKGSSRRAPPPAPGAVSPALKDPHVLLPAVRDFARRGKFDRFFQHHRAFYKKATEEVAVAATAATAAWVNYTGLAVPTRRMVLTAGRNEQTSFCVAQALGAADAAVLAWSKGFVRSGPANIMIGSGLTELRPQLAASGPDRSSKQIGDELHHQIVRAVFVRIDALARGERAGAASEAREVRDGHILVPRIAARLKHYERNRGRYETLNHFLPVLIRSLPRSDYASTGGRLAEARPSPEACQV